VIILNGRYPQVTLVDGSLASGSSSHTTVAVADCIEQSPTTSLVHQSSQLMISFCFTAALHKAFLTIEVVAVLTELANESCLLLVLNSFQLRGAFEKFVD